MKKFSEYAEREEEQESVVVSEAEGSDDTDGDDEELVREDQEEEKIVEIDFPNLTSIARRIKHGSVNMIVNIINEKLMECKMSEILHMPILTHEITKDDVDIGNITMWRMCRESYVADVELRVELTVANKSGDYRTLAGMFISLWYDADDEYSCDLYDMGPITEREDREGWKLDHFLAPVISNETVEDAAEEQWRIKHEAALKEAGERKPEALISAYGLSAEKLPVYKCSTQDHILFFEDGNILVQDPPEQGTKKLPPPREVPVKGKTIIINTRVKGKVNEDLSIYKACFEYEWYYLFYRLNHCVSTDINQFEMRKLCYDQTKRKKKPVNPLSFLWTMSRKGAIGLMMPLSIMREKWWREFQIASVNSSVQGYWNHHGWRNQRIVHVIADEYDLRKYLVRARLINMGKIAAKGALNYDRQNKYYLPAIGFDTKNINENHEFFIPREALLQVYLEDARFRKLMREGVYAYVDGLVCLNDSEFIQKKGDSYCLVPFANAHVDHSCLRFVKSYTNGQGRYSVDWDAFKDENMRVFTMNNDNVSESLKGYKAKALNKMPDSFTGALGAMMRLGIGGKKDEAALAKGADLKEDLFHQYLTDEKMERNLIDLIQICVSLNLPPWLSDKLMEAANMTVRQPSDNPSVYGFILDCLYLETGKHVNKYLQPNVLQPFVDEEENPKTVEERSDEYEE